MFNWKKLLTETLLRDPADIGGVLRNDLGDNLWQIEKCIFAKVYNNSTKEKPLVSNYFWSPNASILRWIELGRNIDPKVNFNDVITPPPIWPYDFGAAETYYDYMSQLRKYGVYYVTMPHYSENSEVLIGNTLAFDRTQLFFCGYDLESTLIGFKVSAHTARMGDDFLFA